MTRDDGAPPHGAPVDGDDDAELSFTCPRCSQQTIARYYGPCPTCRQQLRAAMAGASRDVEAPAYEPKMNVRPNAVATKD